MPRKTLETRIAAAVRHFWKTRAGQDLRQGQRTGRRDHGNRTAATGGRQLDGFVRLTCDLLSEAGIPDETIFHQGRNTLTLPGFFRPTKQWDVLVVADGHLLASIECKALCGPSFGNNDNNRVEEALGSATDLWTAYREGAFADSPKPFLGFVMLLEEAVESSRPVAVSNRHFPVFREFNDASYADRCAESFRRLVRERCYDAASLIPSDRRGGLRGSYTQPADTLRLERFVKQMCGHVLGAHEALQD